jgi:hypothetical protein
LGMCLLPISALAALLAIVTGLVSVVRTTRAPELDGRAQAFTGLGLGLLWVVAAGLLLLFAAQAH